MNKKYGYIIGRFSPVTKGHQRLIDYALDNVDELLILVGSADKKNTYRNPYCVETRIKLLEKVYKKEIEEGRIILKPLNDLTNELDVEGGKWGRYLLDNVRKYIDNKKLYSIYGSEEKRKMWYNKEDLENVTELILDRTDEDISATKVRKLIATGDYNTFKKMVSEKIYDEYENLRKELLETKEYLEMSRGKKYE